MRGSVIDSIYKQHDNNNKKKKNNNKNNMAHESIAHGVGQ